MSVKISEPMQYTFFRSSLVSTVAGESAARIEPELITASLSEYRAERLMSCKTITIVKPSFLPMAVINSRIST